MDRHYILDNGVAIPSVGFGTWQAEDGDTCVRAVETALLDGYRHIDGAAVYGNEKSVGEGIRRSGVPREEIFVTGKLWNTERGYDKALRAFDKTLGDLGLDYLDLYLIHWPATPHRHRDWQELNTVSWRAMERLADSGLVRAIGVSNFMPRHLQPLLASANVVPAVNQIEFHPGFMQSECVEWCRSRGILIEAWSPLGRGQVLGHEAIRLISDHHGKTPAQVCIRWALQHGVLPLPKSVTPERIAENLDVWDFVLSAEEMATIDAMPECGASGLDPDTVDF